MKFGKKIIYVEGTRSQLEREFRQRKKVRAKELKHAPAVQLSLTAEHRLLHQMVQGRPRSLLFMPASK